MGLFGGWRKKKPSKEADAEGSSANPSLTPQQQQQQQQQQPAPDTSVFEFGSAGIAGEERITIAGYCPVSNDLEPCRWEVMPAPPPPDDAAPLFRIVF